MTLRLLPPAEVLWRAMSPTRMLDGGVEHADVVALQSLTEAGTSWDDAAERLAVVQLDRGQAARQSRHPVTAHAAFRAAAADFLFAQMAFNFDEPRKVDLYQRFTDAVAAAGELAEPCWERVVLPFGAGRLFGWLVRPSGPVAGTVIAFGVR